MFQENLRTQHIWFNSGDEFVATAGSLLCGLFGGSSQGDALQAINMNDLFLLAGPPAWRDVYEGQRKINKCFTF